MSGNDPLVSMIGSGSSPAMLAARALLAGNGVAHRWIDTDADPVGRLLAENVHLSAERPVAVFADGSQLPAPEEFIDPGPGARRGEARGACSDGWPTACGDDDAGAYATPAVPRRT